jgi:hypothetical protein
MRSMTQDIREAAIVASGKQGGTRRKGSAGRGRRMIEKGAGQDREVTTVDVDLWGDLFEKLWEQAEGESVEC